MTGTTEVNQQMREYWTGDGLQAWQRQGTWWEEMLAPFGQALLEAAQLRPGQRVLDVGCGWGSTAIAAAEQVAPDGDVTGVDISPQMLDTAQQRAGADNVSWLEADAQVHPFAPASYDVILSRHGVMFFDDPVAAFGNLRRALRPGGRLVFVCWQDPMQVEWIRVSLGAAIPLVGGPPDLGEPGAPGPFAFADGERVKRLLDGGGFDRITLEAVTRPLRIGAQRDEAVEAVLALPETQEMFASASQETWAAARTAVREAFTPYAGPRGVVMDGTAWLVSAQG